MIEAAQFFHDAAAADANGEENNNTDRPPAQRGKFSKWQQVSPRAWRLVGGADYGQPTHDPFTSPPFSFLTSNGDIHHQAVLNTMNLYLSQTSSPIGTTSPSSSSMATLVAQNGHHDEHHNHHHHHHHQNGFIAGLDIVNPRDRWVQDMEVFLMHRNEIQNASIPANDNNNHFLYQDRHGIAISSPLQLSHKTLTPSLLATNNSTNTENPQFFLNSMTPGGSECPAMEFSCYSGSHNSSSNNNNNTTNDVYIPKGYEDFENQSAGAAANVNKSSDANKTSPVYYLLEIMQLSKANLP